MKYIGIIGRQVNDRITFNKEVIDVIWKYNFVPLGIITNFDNDSQTEFELLKPLIDKCSGFILQGGTIYYDIDLLITKYLYDNNISTLGICLGMQTMAALKGTMGKINNHYSKDKYVHDIIIDKDSKLYEILNKDKIMVNSRHYDYISDTEFKIGAHHNNTIEEIEDESKNFFLGIQWHPESLMDENSILLFNSFFDSIDNS